MNKRKSNSGFTLIELLVVIAIIGLLVGLISAGITKALGLKVKTENMRLVDKIKHGLEQFHLKKHEYPPDTHKDHIQDPHVYDDLHPENCDILIRQLSGSSARRRGYTRDETYKIDFVKFTDKELKPIQEMKRFFSNNDLKSLAQNDNNLKMIVVDSFGRPLIYDNNSNERPPVAIWNKDSYDIFSVGQNGNNERGLGDDIPQRDD